MFSAHFTPRGRGTSIHWIGSWDDPRTELIDVEMRKFLILPGLELRPLRHPTCSQLLYHLHSPSSCFHYTDAFFQEIAIIIIIIMSRIRKSWHISTSIPTELSCLPENSSIRPLKFIVALDEHFEFSFHVMFRVGIASD